MDIDAYVRKYIAMLKNDSTNINSLLQMFSITICSGAKIERTTEIDTMIYTVLTGYQSNIITEDEVVNMFHMLYSGDVEGFKSKLSTFNGGLTEYQDTPTYSDVAYVPYSGGGSSSSSGSKRNSYVVIDIDTDVMQNITSVYSEIDTEVLDIDITIPSLIEEYALPLKTVVQKGKEKVTKALTELKQEIVEILNITADIDECIKDIDLKNITFADIGQVVYDRSQNSIPVELNKETFKKLGYEVDEKGNVTLTLNDKECRYNLNNHKFYVDGKAAFETYFYVPQKALTDKNYSKLNTYTFFAQSNYRSLINNQESNAVMVGITKYDYNTKFDKYDETAMATKFINQIVKTDLNDGNCRNIIGGDSVYGSHSLQIAAKHKDVYNTVYCVNNAAIVTDVNGNKNFKTQFSSIDELKGLDGKDVYFITAPGDENINRGMNSKTWDQTVPYEEGYTYTGLNVVCDNCPNARVHMVYNEQESNKEDLINLFKNLEKKYSNYSYDAKSWNEFANPEYSSHSKGNNITIEAASSSITNFNIHTS